jgi:hypothetical protein
MTEIAECQTDTSFKAFWNVEYFRSRVSILNLSKFESLFEHDMRVRFFLYTVDRRYKVGVRGQLQHLHYELPVL